MADLKSLKLRIVSVKKTQKITKAMKMVAASKLRRARSNAEDARPYASKMKEMVQNHVAGVSITPGERSLLAPAQNPKTVMFLLVTTDRGLCGGLNTNLYKYMAAEIKKLKKKGVATKIWCVGKKGHILSRAHFPKEVIKNEEGFSSRDIKYTDIKDIITELVKRFYDGEFDICRAIYPKFASAISQEPAELSLIGGEVVVEKEEKETPLDYEFEPEKEKLLEELIPHNMRTQLFQAILECFASEQGARMTAMDNAVNNCGDLIKDLSLVYNRTRQAQITTELVEIISAAESI